MKKLISIAVVLVVITSSIFVISFIVKPKEVIAPGTLVLSDGDTVIVSVAVTNDPQPGDGLISYRTDSEENVYGPADFCIDGADAYILNSTNNTVLKFTDGSLTDTIDLDGFVGVRIAAYNGDLYILDNNDVIRKHSAAGETRFIGESRIVIGFDAVLSFDIFDGVIYLTTNGGDSGKIYKIPTEQSAASQTGVEIVNGKTFDFKHIYTAEFLPEEGHSIGHGIKMDIISAPVEGKNDSVTFYSDFWLIGVRLFGVDYERNIFIVKLYEMADKPDFTSANEETLRVYDFQGNLKGVRSLGEKVKSITGQTKVFESGIYELNSLNDKVEIIRLALPDESSVSKYVSPLAYLID
ncbi:MAG: hypothetical protein LBH17_00950 [Oscillospiraceae bacterium]|jgi:hypothetical protein|nr:hypothetical protein [Oscillospiraceae bacterium]